MPDFSDPNMLVENAFTLLSVISPNASELVIPNFKIAVAMVQIVLDEVESILTKGFEETFKDVPTLNMLYQLMQQLPDVLETVIYTNARSPLKLQAALQGVSSFESFCSLSPSDLFLLPPNSTWEATSFMSRLCSFNESDFYTELQQPQFAFKIGAILYQGDLQGLDNLNAAVFRTVGILPRLSVALNTSLDQLLSSETWQGVVYQVMNPAMVDLSNLDML